MYSESQFLPDEWLIELGKITQSWANFEQLFNLMLQKLASFEDPFDPTFTILVAHSSLPQRLDMLASLCEAHGASHPHLGSYKAVIRQIKDAQSVRNRFSHNIIGLDGKNRRGQIATVSARGKLKQQLDDVSLDDLRRASELILAAARATFELVVNPSGL